MKGLGGEEGWVIWGGWGWGGAGPLYLVEHFIPQ